ncbi:MAG: gas vesicle protein [Pseudomonadota bacterium]
MGDPVTLSLASGEEAVLAETGRLVDLVDGLLDNGVVIRGEVWISVADIDLVFLGLDLVLSDPKNVRRSEQGS